MESDNIKRTLYSFIELKQKAINIEKKSIDDYLFAFKYYDIDSEMNLNYLNLLKEKNGFDEKYIKEFLRLMYTLKYEDRIKLKNLLKIEIDNLKIKNFNLKDLNLLHNKTTNEIFIGDWGLGIGAWAQSPIPNPQSPIPNPHIILLLYLF